MNVSTADYATLSDQDLSAMVAKGDNGAFKEIYERYNSLLLIYAYRKLQDREEAKDIVQDVFITIWANQRTFSVNSTLSGYLYKAVLHKVLNNFRHKGFSDKYVDEIQHLITAQTEPADYLIREKDITLLIEKEVAALPDRMREVFEMRTKYYLSNKEIADKLEISQHTVETHMKRALHILRKKFGPHFLLLYLLMR